MISSGPVRDTLIGGLVIESAFYVPIVGQIFSLGFLFRGLGALLLTLITREKGTVEGSSNPVSENTSD